MSILKKPYTISVWDDVWNAATEKFEERRVGIIGADNMLYQGRAIEPNLIRNVNGTKKFSFKMYKYFIDNETGEHVENPFVDWLVSERKVKLQYKGKWYDFIVKNINENSFNYLYTYQLEDALVQELSKNGFGITLDAKLMNNMGTAGELATYVLNETDWSVSSEALVEKVEDNLVYITIPAQTVVHKIVDQTDLNNGVDDNSTVKLDTDWSVLAFYTSCTSKPHRFQFIYIPEGYFEEDNNGKRTPSVPTDENQIINVKDCQYYCEINTPEAKDAYVQHSTFKQFYLPEGFNIIDFGEDGISNNHDTTISVWYRGHRYGFAQDAKYIPALNRYCNIYYKNGTKYYGYVDNDYNSPVILQNIITNTDFKGTTGWVGTYSGVTSNAKGAYGATIESVYGEFPENGNKFSSVIEQLSNGTYNSQKNYQSYLKVTFPEAKDGNQGILVNTGFYDNRTSIGEVDYDEEWYFEPTVLYSSGQEIDNPYDVFNFVLREVSFDPTKGSYTLGNIWATLSTKEINEETIHCLKFNGEDKKNTSGYADVKIPKKDFKKKEIKLVITPKTSNNNQTYYIEDMQLFKLMLNDAEEIIKPGDLDIEGVIKTTHRFFLASEVEDDNEYIKQEAIDVEAITYENFDKTAINYSVYKPQYNQGAQKVRSVDAKESNYFNILQSIAEKFEAWLELEIGRNEQGGVTSKTVKFKNYAGKDNYASFRYGVNLKDIQRTYESKNIVTKLIVKQNNNEHAENGFCTIARAGANQTGENYIYDFRYYHDRGMLNATDYISSLYYSQNPLLDDENTIIEQGPDLATNVITNYHNQFSANTAFASASYSFKNGKEYKIKLKIKTEQVMSVAVGWGSETKTDYQATKADNEEVTLIYSITPDEDLSVVWLYYYKDSNNEDGAIGKDFTILSLEIYQNYNLQNYFNRIKNLNVKIQDKNDIIIPKQNELIKLKADLAVQEGLRDAATEGLEEVREEFQALTGTTPETASATLIDMTSSNIQSMLTEYATYMAQYNDAKMLAGYTAENGTEVVGSLQLDVAEKETEIKQAQTEIETLVGYKKELNKLFYSRYSRFIQEGTWIDEKYIDDNKYYADAQSVMYNSCYPQTAYTINVIALSALPGYEYFDFELGDRTYAIDPEFFGEDNQEAVIINELSENLDDPSKDQIKVQNFKNQFQDLFQKITATVQQAQYSSGAYEKAVALAEASAEIKSEFLQDALTAGMDKLSIAGQTTVKQGTDGITLTDSSTQDQMRLIGGAILMSVQDENGQRKWKTGLTPEGISATLVTAGTLNAGNIAIMNVNEPVFRWDAFGITAYDAQWYANDIIGPANYNQFVRFDKYGLYGIGEDGGKDGRSWKPMSKDEIDLNSTFALTWEGLKVVSTDESGNKTSLRIGNNAKTLQQDNTLLSVKNNSGETTFAITNNGSIIWGSGEDNSSSPFQMLYSSEKSQPAEKPENGRLWSSYPQTGTTEWHRAIQPTDWYASYTSNGGATWSVPIRIVSANTSEIVEWYYATANANETPLGPNDTGYTTAGWGTKWKSSPSKAGHSAVNKYLWNYEETKLSNGTSKYSSPALITTQPKSIDKIYEFYLVTSTASVPDKPSGFSWNGTKLTYTNTNPTWECIDTSNATSASSKRVAQSEYMWNFEVICYDDATCSVGSIANIGTGGIDSYKISLSNDVDVIVYDNAGTLISNLPEVTVYRHIGNAESTIGDVSITTPGEVWSEVSLLPSPPQASQGYYSYNSSTGVFKILKMPSSYSDGAFIFTWNKNGSVYGSAKFQFKKVISTADYDLVIAQTVFNSSEAGGTFTISVLKKSNEGTTTLTGPGSELKLYRNGVEVSTIGGTGSNKNNWAVQNYERHEKNPITYVLKSADGSIIWDEEVVEFTQDGASIKRLNTYLRNFAYSAWVNYAVIGHQEPWWTDEVDDSGIITKIYDNSDIRIGDTIYFNGIVTDRYSNTNVNQDITLYGEVISIARGDSVVGQPANGKIRNSITVKTTAAVWGGTQGDTGASPYTISLDNDFVSVPADENKNIADTWGIWVKPTVYCGDEEADWEPASDDSEANLQLNYTSTNLTVIPSTSGGDYFVKELTGDVGTVKFVLYNGEKKVAETKFEAVKQIKGASGDPGTYVYAVAEPNVLHKGNLANIKIQMYKRVGSDEPEKSQIDYYCTLSIDGGTSKNFKLPKGYFAIGQSQFSDIKKTLQIVIYSDSDRTVVVDKITIEALEDGESVYILYHDAITSGSLDKPSKTDYTKYGVTAATEGDDKWYTKQTEDSVYSVSKVCKISDQANTDWGPINRISGVLTTYDDLWNALDEKSTENSAYGGIYTIQDGDDKYIGVKADFIKTGALSVGNHPTFGQNGTVIKLNDNIFYADIENKKVLLAGWEVSSTKLKTGTIGEAGSFGIYPLGADGSIFPSEDDECYGLKWKDSLMPGDAWVMTAGKNFGLTKNGYLYANAGQIGNMTIEAVEALPGAINAAKKAAEDAQSTANSKMSSSITSGDYRWTFSNTDGILMYNGNQSTNLVFKVDANGLYIDGAINCSGSQTFSGTITNHNTFNNLVMKAGNNFGVSATGVLYCNDIQATGGKIGSWTIDTVENYGLSKASYLSNEILYNNSSSIPSAFYGTENQGGATKAYLSNIGVHIKQHYLSATKNADDFVSWAAIVQSAMFYCKFAENYLTYDDKYSSFDYNNYYDIVKTGMTGWIRFPIDGGVSWTWRSALFVNGLLVKIYSGKISAGSTDALGYGIIA